MTQNQSQRIVDLFQKFSFSFKKSFLFIFFFLQYKLFLTEFNFNYSNLELFIIESWGTVVELSMDIIESNATKSSES